MENQKQRFYTYALAAVLLIVAVAIKWLVPDMEWTEVTAEIAVYVGLATTLLALVKSNPTKYEVTKHVEPAETPEI